MRAQAADVDLASMLPARVDARGPRCPWPSASSCVNSAVLLIACLALALGPATVSAPIHRSELLVLLAGVVATMGANLVLVRRAFTPLQRLTRLMRTVDPLAPGRACRPGPRRRTCASWPRRSTTCSSDWRTSAATAPGAPSRAQEAERRRLARELHDELGQSLTGVLLQIDQAIRTPEAADLEEAREGARRSLDDVRRIARNLRPDTLVELGLPSALNALATRFTRQSGVPVDRQLEPDLPALGEDVEVVLYRVAQEALTNVARHADARQVTLALAHADGTSR